jgi:bifunctional hydroxylase/dehydrase
LPNVKLAGDVGPSGQVSALQLLNPGRGVVLDLADSVDVRAAAGPWIDRVDMVTATCDSPAGPLDGVQAALVRPDGYLAWISSNGAAADGLADALARWFGPKATQPR